MFLCLLCYSSYLCSLFLNFDMKRGKNHETANHPIVFIFAVSSSVTQSTRTLQWILHNFLICQRKPQNPRRPLTLNRIQRTTQVTHMVCLYTHQRFISQEPHGQLSSCFYFKYFSITINFKNHIKLKNTRKIF